jgi:hypothetical protein
MRIGRLLAVEGGGDAGGEHGLAAPPVGAAEVRRREGDLGLEGAILDADKLGRERRMRRTFLGGPRRRRRRGGGWRRRAAAAVKLGTCGACNGAAEGLSLALEASMRFRGVTGRYL